MANQFLENERIALEEKITEARDKGNENTYKNLIQAYERVLELIRKENKWEDMYSHYKMDIDGEWVDVVSTWRQKGEDIQEHKVYKIEKEITDKSTYKLYYDVSRNETIKNTNPTNVFYKDKMYCVHTNLKETADYIKKLIGTDNVDIYGDTTHLGVALSDYLSELGIEVKPMKIMGWY